MKRIRKRGRLARLEARIESIEERLALPPAAVLAGQQTIPVEPTIGHHAYTGPGPCRDIMFGTVCGQHRDAHHLIDEDDQP
ncbi:hypothetical protein KVH31_34860 [Streptomyces olivaceus]|uniref:hypothetical protein n=1 Tax=Streptomyces olivaceus TaxID=47716 RepID=UPI001CCF30CD|nr:hypothetical protein [Streptomyces olivaceus]MBZ6211680.1 hypothetical protein [Streptomyces olivaceus]